MNLSCHFREWEPGFKFRSRWRQGFSPGRPSKAPSSGEGWYFIADDDFSTLNTKRARRCVSCKALIKPGSEVLRFDRWRGCESWVEEKIYSVEKGVPIASWYHCAACGEQALNLMALGYCINPDDNMIELLREYQDMTGFKRAEGVR